MCLKHKLLTPRPLPPPRQVSLVEEVYSRGMSLMNMAERAHHLFALHYPLVIQNYLPYRVQIKSKVNGYS